MPVIERARDAFESSSASPFLDQAMRRLIEPNAGMTPGPSATVRQPRLERYEVLGVIGAVNSFRAVADAVEPSFGGLAWTVPIGVDVGIAVFTVLAMVGIGIGAVLAGGEL